MAVIKPFRGVRYNPTQITNLQEVVSQPYDRIDADLQTQYYDLNPYNVVRIIQGKTDVHDRPSNPDGPNVYTRARSYYHQWLNDGILMGEEQPALYVYEQKFTVDNQQCARLGLIAAIELTDFDTGIILPHEKIHSGPKEDRLRLLNTIQAHTEQISILYPDPENKVNALIHHAIGDRQPDIDFVEFFENHVQQRCWIITDPMILQAIQSEMASMRGLIIADGHHRYSTGLNYRDAQRKVHPNAAPHAAFNFIQATLISMNDPGLLVLPTHREICNFSATSPATILERARQFFIVESVSDLASCLEGINAHLAGHTFGFYSAETGFSTLTLKATIIPLIDGDYSLAWQSLSVSILHKILLEQIAQVPGQGIEDKSMIRYHRDAQMAVDNVAQGRGNFVFFISATRMDQIKTIAANGEQMPQKSTDFYPKVISGLSILPLGLGETL